MGNRKAVLKYEARSPWRGIVVFKVGEHELYTPESLLKPETKSLIETESFDYYQTFKSANRRESLRFSKNSKIQRCSNRFKRVRSSARLGVRQSSNRWKELPVLKLPKTERPRVKKWVIRSISLDGHDPETVEGYVSYLGDGIGRNTSASDSQQPSQIQGSSQIQANAQGSTQTQGGTQIHRPPQIPGGLQIHSGLQIHGQTQNQGHTQTQGGAQTHRRPQVQGGTQIQSNAQSQGGSSQSRVDSQSQGIDRENEDDKEKRELLLLAKMWSLGEYVRDSGFQGHAIRRFDELVRQSFTKNPAAWDGNIMPISWTYKNTKQGSLLRKKLAQIYANCSADTLNECDIKDPERAEFVEYIARINLARNRKQRQDTQRNGRRNQV